MKNKNKKEEVLQYTPDVEDLFIKFLANDPELFTRCRSIVNPANFSVKQNQKAIEFILKHADQYSTLPTKDQIKAITGKDVSTDGWVKEEHHIKWFIDEFQQFCRHKSLESAILTSTDLLEEGRYSEVEKKIKDAVQIGLIRDLGTDYFADPIARLNKLRDRSNIISTGWRAVDEKLYGGFGKGELAIFTGQSGQGKSLFLQNLALNWVDMGMNVVYLSLELSEQLCSMRIDAMTTGYGTRDVMKNIDDVGVRIKALQQKTKANFHIKQLPTGCNKSQIRAYVKEYEIQFNRKVDALLIDYLDLCMPVDTRVSPSDLFVKDKFVSEELRDLAVELQIPVVTASQLNRSSYEEIDYDPSHIAGGISKVNTADNVIAIFSTHSMKENGKYQLQFLKTRSSSGVGSRIDLKFDIQCLRITDLSEEDLEHEAQKTSGALIDTLKKKSAINRATADTVESVQEAGNSTLAASEKLRKMLRKDN